MFAVDRLAVIAVIVAIVVLAIVYFAFVITRGLVRWARRQ